MLVFRLVKLFSCMGECLERISIGLDECEHSKVQRGGGRVGARVHLVRFKILRHSGM